MRIPSERVASLANEDAADAHDTILPLFRNWDEVRMEGRGRAQEGTAPREVAEDRSPTHSEVAAKSPPRASSSQSTRCRCTTSAARQWRPWALLRGSPRQTCPRVSVHWTGPFAINCVRWVTALVHCMHCLGLHSTARCDAVPRRARRLQFAWKHM